MSRPLHFARALALVASLAACGRPGPRTPDAHRDALSRAYASAAEVEQLRDGAPALDAYVALVEQGLAAGSDGGAAVVAGLDALLWRDAIGFGRVAMHHALAFRVPGGLASAKKRLSEAYARGRGAGFARAFVAEAIADIARFEGDAKAAAVWRSKTGVATTATVVGPLDAAPLAALERATVLEGAAAKLETSYAGVAPFAAHVAPMTVEADDGTLDVTRTGTLQGLYAAAVDVKLPRAQTTWLVLRSTSAVVLGIKGAAVLTRPFELGSAAAVRIARVALPAGLTRLVVRVAQNDDGGRFSLWVLGEDGLPVASSAPALGSSAPGAATGAEAWEPWPAARPPTELAAAAMLALGNVRAARRALEPVAGHEGAPPLAALVYARAVDASDDVPDVKRLERARSAYERVLKGWPASWEATVGRAVYGSARKGPGEARVEVVREISRARAERSSMPFLVRAVEGATAMEGGLRDVALDAYASLERPLAGAPLLAALDGLVHARSGVDASAFLCNAPGLDRQSLACFQALLARGDAAAAVAEIERLRALRRSPTALRQQELNARLVGGDFPGVLRVDDSMLPGERTLAVLGAFTGSNRASRATRGAAEVRFGRDEVTARDSPTGIAPLLRLLGDDPAPAFEAGAARVVATDRAHPASVAAATFVLMHDERYVLDERGLLRFVVHDVRRVGGSTDVEQGPGGTSIGLVGRDARRILRRRIYKKDGRVLEPDRAANASQGNADLSQLEPGDYIEQLIEGFALPNRVGQIVVDTPDLLPERTSVANASIEVRTPRSLALARWAHPLLGTPAIRDEGDARIVRYVLHNAPPRRADDDSPRMDREVSASFGTYTWPLVAQQLGELVRATADHDPEVARWAREAAAGAPPASRASLTRLVAASGKTVRVANGSMYSDVAASLTSGPQQITARQVLDLGQGSRTLLLERALASLGVSSEIAVAERGPFSADAAFPARPGRFEHPLLVVHLPANEGGDVWVDADVDGPPLPAGTLSPELRGRVALRPSGAMGPIEPGGEATRDEVDIRLVVDERGDARGTVAVALRGRPAQALAEALERVVGSERLDLLRNVVLGWMPWANVNDVALSSAEGSWQVAVRAEIVVPAYAQIEGRAWLLPGLEPLHAVYPRALVSTIGAAYTTRLGRESALAVDAAFQYHVRRRIELPPWAIPLGALPEMHVEHERLEARRTGRATNNVVEEEFTLSLSTGTVGASAYPAFARDAKRVDDAFLAGVRTARATTVKVP